MKSDICHVNILQPPLCTEKKKRKKLYFDQENDAWKAFYYGAAAATEGGPRLMKSQSDPCRPEEEQQQGRGGKVHEVTVVDSKLFESFIFLSATLLPQQVNTRRAKAIKHHFDCSA